VDAGCARTLSLFPENRCEAITGDASVVQQQHQQWPIFGPPVFGPRN
jgi:hypothetical protein